MPARQPIQKAIKRQASAKVFLGAYGNFQNRPFPIRRCSHYENAIAGLNASNGGAFDYPGTPEDNEGFHTRQELTGPSPMQRKEPETLLPLFTYRTTKLFSTLSAFKNIQQLKHRAALSPVVVSPRHTGAPRHPAIHILWQRICMITQYRCAAYCSWPCSVLIRPTGAEVCSYPYQLCCTQGRDDVLPRSAKRWQHTAHKPHGKTKAHPATANGRGKSKRKGKL